MKNRPSGTALVSQGWWPGAEGPHMTLTADTKQDGKSGRPLNPKPGSGPRRSLPPPHPGSWCRCLHLVYKKQAALFLPGT